MDARTQRRLKRSELREKQQATEAAQKAQKIKREKVKNAFREQSRKQALALKNAVDCAVGPSFSLKKINDELRKKGLVVMSIWEMEASKKRNDELRNTIHSLRRYSKSAKYSLMELSDVNFTTTTSW